MFGNQQSTEAQKIKVIRQLESIKEKPYDSDNNGAGQGSDKNESCKSGEESALERQQYLEQNIIDDLEDEEEGKPQVEYLPDTEL